MMYDRRTACTALLLVSLVTPLSIQAETLEQAWAIALEADHGLKAVKENSAAAAEQLAAAKSARLPNLSVAAGYTAMENDLAAKASLGGVNVDVPMGERESHSYQATVSLPIYTSGKISGGINAASSVLSASRSQLTSSRLDLKLEVAESFVAVLRASKGSAVALSHVDSLQSHAGDVKNFYQQGMVSKNDLLAAKVALADAEQSAIKVENSLDIAKSAYNRFLNRALSQPVMLDEVRFEENDEGVELLTERALAQRHELWILSDQIEALRHQAKAVRAETLPQIALNGGYGYQENRYQVHEGQWQVNLGLQWQLFDGGVAKHRASSIKRGAAMLKAQHDDLASKVALQVRQYWLDSQETRKRILVAEKTIVQAKENLKVSRNRYENGLSTNTEVLDAETLRTGSENNHANALYDAVLASLRLKRSLGEL